MPEESNFIELMSLVSERDRDMEPAGGRAAEGVAVAVVVAEVAKEARAARAEIGIKKITRST